MRKGRARRRSKVSRPSIPAESRAPKSAEHAGTSASVRIVTSVPPPSGSTPAADRVEARGEIADVAIAPAMAEPEASANAGEEEKPTAAAEADNDAEAGEAEAGEAEGEGVAPAAPSTEPMLESDPDPTLRDAIPEALRDGAKAAKAAAAEVEEETSIPPVGDVVVEEFFSEGDVGKHLQADELDEAVLDPKVARKNAPDVVQRRTRLARYVTWAVGVSVAMCVVALGRSVVASRSDDVASASAGNAIVVAANDPPAAKEATNENVNAVKAESATDTTTTGATVDPPSGEPAPADPSTAAAAAPTADAPTATATTATSAPSETTPAASETTPAASETTPDPKAAAAEKSTARRALEGGKLQAAIDAGERSVALDPTDGEAWLLLGAAYQEKGRAAEARRAYTACVKQGKRGPIGECRAMLR